MKILWLCNMIPGDVKKAITGKEGNGLWVDHVLADLRREEDLSIRILCPDAVEQSGVLDEHCSYATFTRKAPYQYLTENEARFRSQLQEFAPDVIHIWGTEYAHTLAMVRAAQSEVFLDRVVISIQGLCSIYARHFVEGVPSGTVHGMTLRDLLRQDNLSQQRKKFVRRGELEIQALEKVSHVIGRTCWDRACTQQLAPNACYHFCNETLREPFYRGTWQYENCRKYRIFASSCVYPIKGFHYLLEAFAQVLKTYPQATLSVPGKNYLQVNALHRNSYQKYLAKLTRQYGLEDKIEFLGSLDAEGMRRAYLEANVFTLPSTIENSPNSLGEAMLLGLPCVAADVGGVSTMMKHDTEGFLYQGTAPYMLAHYIREVFAMEAEAENMGFAAKHHAQRTHDPEENCNRLLEIYGEIAL